MRRFGIKEGLSEEHCSLWLCGSLRPGGFLDDRAAAACIAQWIIFWMGRNFGHILGLDWPGRGWKVYSLGVLEGTGSEAEA